MSQKFSGAIFDLDGTLLDSMGVWSEVDRKFLARRGLSVPKSYVKELAAMSFYNAAIYTINLFSLSEEPQAIMDEWFNLALEEYSFKVKVKPNGIEYLKSLKSQGVKLGVATGLTVGLMEPVLKNNGIYDMFDAICSADNVGCGKGTPEIFLRTAEKIGTEPAGCIVFEDIPQGAKSAKEAGMTVYGVYDKHSEAFQDELKAAADGYITDFSQAPMFLR